MKITTTLAAATTLGLVQLGSTALAQSTVYSDNFGNDSSLSSSYLNINNISGTSNQWSFAANSQLTLTTAASGKLDDLVGSFSTVSLAQAGDYVSFVVNFNSPNIGQSGTAGNLLFSLNSSKGTGLLSAGAGPESPTATTGATASYVGYMGDIAFNTTPKTGSKLFAKTGTGANDLSYNSDATPDTQLSTTIGNASNANLVNGDSYTLTYIITALNAGASQEQITEQIFDNTLGVMEDNFSAGATNGASYLTPTTSYDTFDVGVYTGSESSGYDINLTSLSVLTNTGVPEPGPLALTAAGMGLAFLFRFRRR
jgi:hypothetical protein